MVPRCARITRGSCRPGRGTGRGIRRGPRTGRRASQPELQGQQRAEDVVADRVVRREDLIFDPPRTTGVPIGLEPVANRRDVRQILRGKCADSGQVEEGHFRDSLVAAGWVAIREIRTLGTGCKELPGIPAAKARVLAGSLDLATGLTGGLQARAPPESLPLPVLPRQWDMARARTSRTPLKENLRSSARRRHPQGPFGCPETCAGPSAN